MKCMAGSVVLLAGVATACQASDHRVVVAEPTPAPQRVPIGDGCSTLPVGASGLTTSRQRVAVRLEQRKKLILCCLSPAPAAKIVGQRCGAVQTVTIGQPAVQLIRLEECRHGSYLFVDVGACVCEAHSLSHDEIPLYGAALVHLARNYSPQGCS